MCEAKMDPESPEDSDKQNMIDIKSNSRNANSESPSPPTGPASAASPQTTTTSTSTVTATTPPIKHCPLTPQSQVTAGDDDDEDEEAHEQDGDVSDQIEDEEEEEEERSHHRHHTPARNRHHHHMRHRNHHHHRHHNNQQQPYHYGADKMENDGDNVTSEDEDLISVGGSPSPSSVVSSDHHFQQDLSINSINSKRNHRHLMQNPEEEYFKPLKKLRMLKVESPTSQNAVGVKSFSISDILSHKPTQKKNHTTKSSNSSGSSNCSSRTIDIENVVVNTHHHHQQQQQRIVRPWDPHQQSNKSNGRRNSSDSSPLDALFQMTSKTFEGLNGHHESSEFGGQGNAHQAFNARQPPKKKRKSRTAFTNHQIFELEKRFLYQKYLSPADRDDIAHQLGLTNAQVITWFQNRRAKLKRDLEEVKKDRESLHMLSAHKTFLESAHDLALLKKRAQSMDMSSAAAAALAATTFHISSPTSSSQSSHSPINLTSESPPSTH